MKTGTTFLLISLIIAQVSTAAHAIDKSSLKPTGDGSGCVTYYSVDGVSMCGTNSLDDEASPFDPRTTEKLKISFDNRIWRAAWANVLPSGSTVEYVVDEQKVTNWTELITSQVMPGLAKKATAVQFAKMVADQLAKSVEQSSVVFRKENPQNAVFEFTVTAPASLEQLIIERIFVVGDDLNVVQYAVKGKLPTEPFRQSWIEHLSATSR